MKLSEYILLPISQRKKEEVSENPQTILLQITSPIIIQYMELFSANLVERVIELFYSPI